MKVATEMLSFTRNINYVSKYKFKLNYVETNSFIMDFHILDPSQIFIEQPVLIQVR